MSEALQLFDVPAVPRLTDRQQTAFDAIKQTGYDGLHTDEVGAIVHGHPDGATCQWCGSAGQELGRALRAKQLVQQRRRKAPNGDTVTVWTIAGKLPPPAAERDDGSAFNRDPIPF
jgi:hypothetical protein